jgi:RHS repeat-associated protein
MRLSRLLALIASLVLTCASAQAHVGAFPSESETARRGFLPDLATASRVIERVTAGRVWENYDCARELASGSCVDAFGVEIRRSGSTDVEHLYRGEAFDPNVGFYYLRARWMDPRTGRFTQQDRWAGRVNDPLTLNKYLYAHANPVDGWDPTGFFTQRFGYAVEEEIERQYRASHPECGVLVGFPCYFGVRQYYSPLRYLKPDVMNWASKTFLEIKPFSPSGIAKAGPQLAAYIVAYQAMKFSPDTSWTPAAASVLGTPTFFANAGGVIFYTDDRNAAREWAALSIATASMIFRRYATSTATRLGADAVARVALNNALRVLATANVGRISFQASTVVLTRF